MIDQAEAARVCLSRRNARTHLADYIQYTFPSYKRSWFSDTVCSAIDRFIERVVAGDRPVLVLQSPPQMGKSEIVSRRLPAYLMGRFPDWRVGLASYSDELANAMAQDVRRNLASPDHQTLFPAPEQKDKYSLSRIGEFNAPGGSGSMLSVGIGAGLTGRTISCGIVDDPTRDARDALSETVKESQWNWYQSVFSTRLSEHSGQIIMATSWAQDDLPGRILDHFKGDPRLTHLRFPAINLPTETGYDPTLPGGALCPELKSLEFLQQQKTLQSDYWWAALYQQSPKVLGGNVFKDKGIRYYNYGDLPREFDRVIDSWDATFKDTDGTDFVAGGKWGKKGANAYLFPNFVRKRMGFVETAHHVKLLAESPPFPHKVLIEDKANGPAVIDFLKKDVPRIFPVEPDGSKLARAHAITGIWEGGNIWLPDPAWCPATKAFTDEMTAFPASAHDDQVDMTTQAIRELYPMFGRLKISQAAIDAAMRQ